MCGITGTLFRQPQATAQLQDVVTRMSDTLTHRGPDDSGTWCDPQGQCGLGFRRLSIIDLSPNGHQPMSSPSGRFTIVFNGEIYNHLELRRDLEKLGITFRGHSDTETLCAAVEHWGMSATIKRCIGMFAIAVWDTQTRTLSLTRDRLGIKPLYYTRTASALVFASELKAIRRHPAFMPSLNTHALGLYLRHLYVPAPHSIYEGVVKVAPGTIVTIDQQLSEAKESYWSLDQVYEAAQRNPFEGSANEAVEQLEELLRDAVQLRMLADVPLGALLSGGIDSSTVVALMQRSSSTPVRTFSIGFTSSEHDESRHAARIADYLRTEHTPLMLDGADSLAVIPDIPRIFDEPFADPSQIPTYLVCRLARNDVTVALTGDGGDEVFAGYHRYIEGHRLIRTLSQVPSAARHAGSAALRALSNGLYPVVAPVAALSGQRLVREKLSKLSRMLAESDPSAMYRSLVSVGWTDPRSALLAWPDPIDPMERLVAARAGSSVPLLDRMMLADQALYLPDDLLAKVDRASMAVSLEARVPLLDHRVVEFSWRLPAQWKVQGRTGKWALRQILYRHIPRELVDRPKVGFTVPIAEWLRGPLRSWAEEQFAAVGEPLNRTVIQNEWSAFKAGRSNRALAMWAVVVFQAWRAEWRV